MGVSPINPVAVAAEQVRTGERVNVPLARSGSEARGWPGTRAACTAPAAEGPAWAGVQVTPHTASRARPVAEDRAKLMGI